MGGGVARLVAALDERLAAMAPDDAARSFTGVYRRTTAAVGDEIARGGFLDGEWVDRWDEEFGLLYLRPLDAHRAGQPVSGPWRVAFRQWETQPELPPLRHVLVGINAHINYDLPQALLAVISDAELDDAALRRRRARDHEHVDEVLAARVAAEDLLLRSVRAPSLLDRVLTPLNRLSTRRLLRESRAKVWANTALLSAARRRGPQEYAARLAELERLAAARVADLVAPGQVLLRLARTGFGVSLSPDLPP